MGCVHTYVYMCVIDCFYSRTDDLETKTTRITRSKATLDRYIQMYEFTNSVCMGVWGCGGGYVYVCVCVCGCDSDCFRPPNTDSITMLLQKLGHGYSLPRVYRINCMCTSVCLQSFLKKQHLNNEICTHMHMFVSVSLIQTWIPNPCPGAKLLLLGVYGHGWIGGMLCCIVYVQIFVHFQYFFGNQAHAQRTQGQNCCCQVCMGMVEQVCMGMVEQVHGMLCCIVYVQFLFIFSTSLEAKPMHRGVRGKTAVARCVWA